MRKHQEEKGVLLQKPMMQGRWRQIRKKQRIRENSLSGTILNIKTPPRQGVFEKFDKK